MTSREHITVNKRSKRRSEAEIDIGAGFLEINQEINQALAMTLGMHLRNRLEPFRARYLPDAAMPELNATIRYAIYDFFMNVASDDRQLAVLVASVPDDWEIPGIDPLPTFTHETKRRSPKQR